MGTEVASLDRVERSIANLKSGEIQIFNTIPQGTEEAADLTLDALSNAVSIDDHLGETINLAHVIVEIAEGENEQTGEIGLYPRITLLDADGTSYVANSQPVLNELERVFAVRGMPETWTSPYPIVITREKGSKPGRTFFKMVRAQGAPKK